MGAWFGVTDSAGRVVRVRLRDNGLEGALPTELGALSALAYLEVGGNRLGDSIPPELGDLARLRGLWLDDNELVGPLPEVLGDLADLHGLWVGGNRLSGSVPASFLELDDLLFFEFGGDGDLCLPGTEEFARWVEDVGRAEGPWCGDADAEVLRSLYKAAGGAHWANLDGWLTERLLGRWHGVETDRIGRVSELDLTGNGLSGFLPRELGRLDRLASLKVGNDSLLGRLPQTLTALDLDELRYVGTALCAPDNPTFREWLDSIPEHHGTGVACAAQSDRDLLVEIYEATGGPDWVDNTNWMSGRPLGQWYGVTTDNSGNVTRLDLSYNNLTGSFPPELGDLDRLEVLRLRSNRLTGPLPREFFGLENLDTLDLGYTSVGTPIPPEIGRLGELRYASLTGTELAGPIPPELGSLDSLQYLALGGNDLTGPIPAELGNLSALRIVYLWSNDLSGEIPVELGGLANLYRLSLQGNRLSGRIPAEFGNLDRLLTLSLSDNELDGMPAELGNMDRLIWLYLEGNALRGQIPSALGGLRNLQRLWIGANEGLWGRVPSSFADLTRLQSFKAGGTDVCVPADPGLLDWLDDVPVQRVARCEKGLAYLTQAVQSREHPVPLVEDQPALLRVFVTSRNGGDHKIPEVRATFYLDGEEVYVADIESGTEPIPKTVDESDLGKSANASISRRYIESGLEMVVEIDPDDELHDSVDIVKRIPEEGRMAIDVKDLPDFRLTLIPFLYESDPDSSILDITEGMEDDPWSDPMMAETRELLPIDDFDIELHDPVVTSSNNGLTLLRETEMMRRLDGGSGYWLGMLAPAPRFGLYGVAWNIPSWSSFSVPLSRTVAHELGHNLGLFHAPCGGAGGPDPLFPDRNGRIGAHGYDRRNRRLVSRYAPDLMSYCRGNTWISDYHFANALRRRLSAEAHRTVKTRSLIVWGGLDADGKPFLDPSFIADAIPSPSASGHEFQLRGKTEDGEEAFSLIFDMPEIPDIEDERSAFVFAVPVTWDGALESIILSGVSGSDRNKWYGLHRESNQPLTILKDEATGRVRAILRTEREAALELMGDEAGSLEALFTTGIPR